MFSNNKGMAHIFFLVYRDVALTVSKGGYRFLTVNYQHLIMCFCSSLPEPISGS